MRSWLIGGTTAQTVIKQSKALPPRQRAQVAKFVVKSDESWIPESFKRGMAGAEAGRFAGMDAILNDAPAPAVSADHLPAPVVIVVNCLKGRFSWTSALMGDAWASCPICPGTIPNAVLSSKTHNPQIP
jgi:hypothetical protein